VHLQLKPPTHDVDKKTRCKGSQDCILSCEVGSSCCDTVWHVVAKFCREQLISCENGTYHVAYNYCKIQYTPCNTIIARNGQKEVKAQHESNSMRGSGPKSV